MGKIILILGGARSGKSSYALTLAGRDKNTGFIATGLPSDREMKMRIAKHKAGRPAGWATYEAGTGILEVIKQIIRQKRHNTVIIDCLTLFISGLVIKKIPEEKIIKITGGIFRLISGSGIRTIIVSNETGLGIVPGNRLSRNFRDIAGRVNQIAAQRADRVYFMLAGLPLRIK